MIDFLTQWMYLVSNHLLPVVLLILTVMSCMVLTLAGGFLREALERRALRRKMESALALVKRNPNAAGEAQRLVAKVRVGLPARFTVALGKHGADDVDRIFDDLNNQVSARLAILTFLTRLGPMGGLIATLLPLGPALHALAGGDMGDLASNLTIAFTATVVGLCVSCLAYTMGVVRRIWYARDMDDLESLASPLVTCTE